MSEVKEKLVSGAIWSLIERFGYLSIQFVSNIILARILFPKDFGVLGILLVFIGMATVIADSGLGAAIIQRKTINQNDKSTAFYVNVLLGIVLYVLIFLIAPYISIYFGNPNVSNYLRVIGLVIVIDSFSSIQNTLFNRAVNFEVIAKIKIEAALVSVLISIILAYNGFGIWSLVFQYITFSIIRCILLWLKSDWKPAFIFDFKSFRVLFDYGYKIMLQVVLSEAYISFQSIFIGKRFNFVDLGYFTQAKQLQQIPVTSISTTINQVSFPVFSSLQDSINELKSLIRQNLQVAAFINFPLMFFLSASAKSIICFLYSDKWIESVPYFQFLCLGFGLLLIVHSVNITALKSIGKSGVVLYLEIIKKLIGVALIIGLSLIWGIWGVLMALCFNSILEFFLNGFFVGKYISYGPFNQFKDIFPIIIYSVLAAVPTYVITSAINDNLLSLILDSIVYIGIYIGLAYLFKSSPLFSLINLVKSKIAK